MRRLRRAPIIADIFGEGFSLLNVQRGDGEIVSISLPKRVNLKSLLCLTVKLAMKYNERAKFTCLRACYFALLLNMIRRLVVSLTLASTQEKS